MGHNGWKDDESETNLHIPITKQHTILEIECKLLLRCLCLLKNEKSVLGMKEFGLKQEDIDKINDVFASYEGIDSVVMVLS
jgi:hypothetical protein